MPPVLESFLVWLESSSIATLSATYPLITSSLSAVHLLGVVLIGGSAVFTGLRLSGAVFAQRPLSETVRPAARIVLVGLAISVTTGVLQFVPRALRATESSYFQLKLLMLAAALLCSILFYRRMTKPGQQTNDSTSGTRLLGVAASVLWMGVVVAGSAYILLE